MKSLFLGCRNDRMICMSLLKEKLGDSNGLITFAKYLITGISIMAFYVVGTTISMEVLGLPTLPAIIYSGLGLLVLFVQVRLRGVMRYLCLPATQ